MKKLALGMLLGIILAIGIVYAAPGDVVITLTIPAAKVADFQAGFLAKCPIPMIEDANGITTPKYTPKRWIKEWIRRKVTEAYRHGKISLAKQAAVVDPNVLQ